jgi:hypothetical protein
MEPYIDNRFSFAHLDNTDMDQVSVFFIVHTANCNRKMNLNPFWVWAEHGSKKISSGNLLQFVNWKMAHRNS